MLRAMGAPAAAPPPPHGIAGWAGARQRRECASPSRGTWWVGIVSTRSAWRAAVGLGRAWCGGRACGTGACVAQHDRRNWVGTSDLIASARPTVSTLASVQALVGVGVERIPLSTLVSSAISAGWGRARESARDLSDWTCVRVTASALLSPFRSVCSASLLFRRVRNHARCGLNPIPRGTSRPPPHVRQLPRGTSLRLGGS